MYPDRLIDYYCSLNPDNRFHLFFYQRLFLRCLMRHKIVYATFVRAWSKSFMSVMGLMLKCILYPGAKVFTVAGGKELIHLKMALNYQMLRPVKKLVVRVSTVDLWKNVLVSIKIY